MARGLVNAQHSKRVGAEPRSEHDLPKGECSNRCPDSLRRFNGGQVLIFNNPRGGSLKREEEEEEEEEGGGGREKEQDIPRRSSASSQYPPWRVMEKGEEGEEEGLGGGDSTSVEYFFSITPPCLGFLRLWLPLLLLQPLNHLPLLLVAGSLRTTSRTAIGA